MLSAYPKFKRAKTGQPNKEFLALPRVEQKLIEDYIQYRKGRGLNDVGKIRDLKLVMTQLRYLLEEDLRRINLDKLRKMLGVISSNSFSDACKNVIKTDLARFIKWYFPNWSKEFLDLDDVKLCKPVNKRVVTSKNILTKTDVEKLMKHEGKMFWKAFLITQYEGGLRTKETRFLKWGDITFNADGDISEINLEKTKIGKPRIIFIKEATFYLQKLKEEQENTNDKGLYVFHSKRNKEMPVNKGTISQWMSGLSQRALGRHCWNYLMRHGRATELYTLVRKGKMSGDTPVSLLGHSKDMRKVYDQLDTADLKSIVKAQLYQLEDLPEEKKNELRKELEAFKSKVTERDETIKMLMTKFFEILKDGTEIKKVDATKIRSALDVFN